MKTLLYIIITTLLSTHILYSAQNNQSEFFEKNIRPVLIDKCYKCHSVNSERVKGGLLVDNKQSIMKGGDTSPAVEVGNPDKSLLMQAITWENKELQMPPKERLDEKTIKDFEYWIKSGAFYPESKTSEKVDIFSVARKHWAYLPIEEPKIPIIKDSWIRNDIDKFILAKQKENKLSPSPEADKRILVRRLYYDLIGLPPTEEEVLEFINNPSKNYYEELVDKLLNSPHYGERWGRKWLDTARYSDTTGTVNANREQRFTYSHTYRDYVIRSLNSDKPFNRFAIEQIAADKLTDINREDLAALGFLTIGKDSANINDVIDDRIDVVTKGFMATTMVCARCHDHKFDPFTTKDYYSLHGIMNSSYVPEDNNKPILKPIKNDAGYKDYLAQRKIVENNLDKFISTNYYNALLEFKTNTAKFLYGSYVLNTTSESEKQNYVRENTLNTRIMQKWGQSMRTPVNIPSKKGKSKSKTFSSTKSINPVYLPFTKMFQVEEKNFANEFVKLLKTEKDNIDPYLFGFFTKNVVKNMKDLANIYQAAIIYSERPSTNSDVLKFRDTIFKNGGPLDIDRDNFQRFYASNQQTMRYDNLLRAERGKLITLELTHPNTPYRAMALTDKVTPVNSPVFIKGDMGTRGPVVEHRFMEFFSSSNKPYKNGSGRLELANDIVNTPLFSKAIVNRLWQGHFEEGFVKTPDDFGIYTEKPALYDLMNYLSWYLINHNYSLKELHRLIVNSATYRQTCLNSPKKAFIDPDNKYLWRMNLIRLDFEEIRDTLLFLANRLDYTMGGPSIDLFSAPTEMFRPSRRDPTPRVALNYSTRRTIYGYIDRNRLPEVLPTFDFATPEMTTGKRFKTTVPKQALFLFNNSFIYDQIDAILKRKDISTYTNSLNKINELYNLIFQRPATRDELMVGESFFDGKYNDMNLWKQFVQVLLMSNELVFIN